VYYENDPIENFLMKTYPSKLKIVYSDKSGENACRAPKD
jgi:hypothetical protein